MYKLCNQNTYFDYLLHFLVPIHTVPKVLVSISSSTDGYFKHCFINKYQELSLLECQQKCLQENCLSLSISTSGTCILNKCKKEDVNEEIENQNRDNFDYYELQ